MCLEIIYLIYTIYTIRVRWTRHARHCWRSRDELISDVLLWTPGQKQDDQLEHTHSSYMRIQVVALRTCQRRWTIRRSGERGSGISMPVVWHDDEWIYTYKKDQALNNLQWLICHKTQPNQIIYIQYICIKRIWH